MKINIKDQQFRAYLYRVVLTVAPLAILYGIVSPEEASLYIALVGALLSISANGLAAANTDRKSETHE